MTADAASQAQAQAQALHGTCLARRGRCVLLRGASGSGKSDLALRFLDRFADAWLIADDRVLLEARDGALYPAAPAPLHGLLEVRGLGLVRRAVPARDAVPPLALIVDLDTPDAIARIAEPRTDSLHGVTLPLVALAPFEGSAPLKLALALETIGVAPGAGPVLSGFAGDDGLLG